MNYYSVPYESEYSEDGANKMGGMAPTFGQSQRPVAPAAASMPMMAMPSAPSGMSLSQLQMPMGGMPQMGGMPMASSMSAMSYPMPGQPLMQPQQMGMMQPMQSPGHQGGHQMSMSPVSMPTMSQIPPGAVTPLNSTTMMPVMGGIDGGGMNVVVPDLQPLSAMSPMPQMQHHHQQQPQQQQHQHQPHSGRLAGGGAASNWMNYANAANTSQMMPGNAWNYSQSYGSMPQQQHQHQPQQRMKSQY
ncbi:hypothetical protein KR093_009395, partial [Drosophila rubida]